MGILMANECRLNEHSRNGQHEKLETLDYY